MADSFDEIQANVNALTRPDQNDLEFNTLAHLATGDDLSFPIAAQRRALLVVDGKMSEWTPTHRALIERDMEHAIRRSRKAAFFMVEAYAHYLDDLQGCRCNICQSENARNN